MSDDIEISDEILMAYSDGELSPDEEQRIEEKLVDDKELRKRLAVFVDTRRFLKSEYLKVKSEGVPDRFKNIIQSSAQRRTSRLQEFFGSLFNVTVVTSAAFSLALGFMLGIANAPYDSQTSLTSNNYRGVQKDSNDKSMPNLNGTDLDYEMPSVVSNYQGESKIRDEKIWINVDGTRQHVPVEKRFTVGIYFDCQVVKVDPDSAGVYMILCTDTRDGTINTMTIE